MKIAQVSPLHESVPPKLYGGTERVVSYLTEELVRQGHDVTLFASGDSETAARLVAMAPESLRLCSQCVDPIAWHMAMVEKVAEMAVDFEAIHFHIDYFHFPVSRRHIYAHLTTLHGRLDLPDLVPLYREYREMPLVSISNAQREPLPWVHWLGTVYHGLPEDLYEFHGGPGKYLAFLGRISPEKRVDRAIEIARRAGASLKIAAKVDKSDREYFESQIKPLLAQNHVEFIGEIKEAEKSDFLGNASALLFPIDWPEPFGLAMIEAMACGVPVIAFRGGSVEEVVDPGQTGFICASIEEAVAAVEQIERFDRAGCRRTFERRFSAARMASDYVELYGQLADRQLTNRQLTGQQLAGLRSDHERNSRERTRTVFDPDVVRTA